MKLAIIVKEFPQCLRIISAQHNIKAKKMPEDKVWGRLAE